MLETSAHDLMRQLDLFEWCYFWNLLRESWTLAFLNLTQIRLSTSRLCHRNDLPSIRMKQLPPPTPPGWYDASVLEIPETWERYAQWARDNYPGTWNWSNDHGESHLPCSFLRGKALLLAEAGAGGLAGWHSRPGEEARMPQVLIVT